MRFCLIFALRFKTAEDLVAQLVEQYTFNVWVLGSSPSQITTNGRINSKARNHYDCGLCCILWNYLRLCKCS